MNKKGMLEMSTGLYMRIIASLVIGVSLPFLITNPTNPIAQGFFAFGNFLMVIGANVK